MAIDDETWQRHLDEQDQVVTRAQALGTGFAKGSIEHRLGRTWQLLLPGIYLTTTGVPTWEQRARAGLLHAGPSSALTAATGLAVWRLAERGEDVHVALPESRRRENAAFAVRGGRVVLHRTTRPLDDRHPEIPTLSVARCVTDACLGLASLQDVRAIVSSAVQRRRTTVELLEAELAMAPQQGSGHLRALAEVGEGAQSVPEAVLARALRSAGLPPYRLNSDVHDEDGTWLARPDVVFRGIKLIVEVDGERWHLDANRWSADVERHTRLEADGWTVLRYPASRVLRDVAGVIAEITRVVSRLESRAS